MVYIVVNEGKVLYLGGYVKSIAVSQIVQCHQKHTHTTYTPIQLIQEAGMTDLSDALLDFWDEIHPHITNSKNQDTKDTFTDADSVVVTALNEAVTWATLLINQGKLYQVCETVTHLHS